MNESYGLGWNMNPVLFLVLLAISLIIVWLAKRPVSWLLPALVMYVGVLWYFPHYGWYRIVFWLICAVVLLTSRLSWSETRLAKWPLYMMTTVIVVLGALMPFRSWLADVGDEHATKPGSSSLSDGSDASTSPSSSPEPEGTESSSPSPTPTVTVTATVTASPSPTPEVSDEPSSSESTPDASTVVDERKYYGAPATIPNGTCPGMLGWDTLVTCVESNDLQWYIDGVNARASQTGFDWSDVKQWAVARTPEGNLPEVRYVQVFGPGVSDAEAKARGRVMTGEDLRVVRQPAVFSNTQGIEAGRMADFDYDPLPAREVRVSLMPLKLNAAGKAVGVLNTRSGVFIDCLNIWWSMN